MENIKQENKDIYKELCDKLIDCANILEQLKNNGKTEELFQVNRGFNTIKNRLLREDFLKVNNL